jgi:amino acid adenylation domain-containing protein
VAACTVSNGPVDDLNIFVVYDLAEQGDTRIEFVANPAAYDQETLARLQCRFLRLLAAVDDPAALIGTLDMLPPDERRQILIDRNQTDAGYPHCRQIHELFEEQARRTPDRVAAVFERQRLTYRELNEQADRVARNLALLGVGPNERVALHVERSLGMLIGLLGILKAGGAYVPLDPNYPRDRLEFILEDCEPLVLLTEQSLRDRLQPRNAATLCLDAMPLQPAVTGPAINLRQASDLAYVLYTSGSTGQPKGVQIPHRAMVNFLCAMRREPGIAAEDRLLAVTSLSFDIAGLELLLPLICGAQVTIAPGEIAASGVYLARLMRDSGATIMQATPATWKILLESGWQGSRDLRILCGGEAWSADLADALLARCASLWNMYGPTETTVWSSVARIERHQPVLIGPPIANTVFYVLDRYRQPVPFGVPGELFIGGDGVARGYLNRPELTRERFVADPFSDKPAARMYQTGDRVRQRSDGRLEFLGRLDHQVKIRGFRIETGEIEVVLRRHPGVRDAVVVARADRTGENRLLAYVIAGGPKPVAVGELRDFLRRKLTPYMVPAAIIPLDAFPLTPNGKVDRNALPLPADQARRDTGVEWIAPRTPSEQLVARLWCDCLQLGQVGINDNFFDLGGDSLAMLRLGLEIERATGQSFPTTYIFNAPTVAGMARILGGRKAISNRSPVVLLRPGSDGPPVFMVHPISGSTVQLIPVAQAFPGRNTIYGIQARGLDGIDAANDRVESMVEYYLNAITELQPHGPYLLMGLCFGGLVAIEIARRLTERGETIDMLACLDTFPHPRYCPFKLRLEYYLIHRVKEAVKTLRGMNRQEMVSYVTTKLKLLLRQSAAQVTGRRSLPTASDFLPPAIKTVFESSVAAAMHYRPLYYAGKMNFLVGGYHAYPEHAPTAVWGGLVGRLEVHSVPAECALVASRHAEYVANWLFNRIQDAAERTSLDDDDAIICYGKAHPHQLAPHIADGHYAETQVPGVGPPAPARRDQSTARPCA